MARLDNELLNELAEQAKDNEASFERLYNELEPHFPRWVSHYLVDKKVISHNFDRTDYISAIGVAVWKAVKGYDRKKGNFYPRAFSFAVRNMKTVTDFNMRGKRFDHDNVVESVDYLEEVMYLADEKAVIEDMDEQLVNTEALIQKFMEEDKDHEVIDILLTKRNATERNEAFIVLFGQYGSTERKRVQRVKERLKKYLTSNGVNINF